MPPLHGAAVRGARVLSSSGPRRSLRLDMPLPQMLAAGSNLLATM